METFFRWIVRRPRAVLVAAVLVVAGMGAGIPRLSFDNRPDSFLPSEHPAFVAKERVEELFGLEDPMLLAVAVVDGEGRPVPGGLFRPHPSEPLRLVEELSAAIARHLEENRSTYGQPGAHPVYSLATEQDVELTGGIPRDRPFLVPFPESPEDLEALRDSVRRLELYDGIIVSRDDSAAGIVIVPPPGRAEEVHAYVEGLAASRGRPGIHLALAGEAAVRSAMGRAVVESALALNPICVAIVVFFLFLAFRNVTGILLPMAVVGAGSAVMLGAMGYAGVPIYIITNAILVTVMSIGVADAIHVLGEYYRELAAGRGVLDRRELVVRALSRLWVPVWITSATDMIGFLSFWVSGIMPPLRWFGVFTAVGVGATLLASFTLLPAALVLVDPHRRSQARLGKWSERGSMVVFLRALGRSVERRPWAWAAAGAVLIALAVWQATGLRVRQSMASTFEETSQIVSDDRLLNERFHGTHFLDVLIEGDRDGAIIEPAALRRIEALETFAVSLPHVSGSTSVAGFARKMHQILNDWDAAANRIPDDLATVREHFELLETSPSKHADLLHVVDRAYRRANVRLRLTSGEYTDEKEVVEAMQAYLAAHFPPAEGLRAELAGRVYMDYHWVKLIVKSHIESLSLTGIAILVALAALFRSFFKALLAALPVAFAVLSTYAAMAALGIPLSIGTSMFASLAIGVGVNFPIHVLDRLRLALVERGGDLRLAFEDLYSLTGKALIFNAAAVCCGFLALLASSLPLMRHFGLMIALGIGSSCIASLTLLPALVVIARRLRRARGLGHTL